MIGTRTLAAAALATLGLVPVLGAGGPRPEEAVAARDLVRERAGAADAALAALEATIESGVGLARTGTARIVAGAEPPGDDLRAAGALVGGLDGLAGSARAALDGLVGARAAAGDDASLPPEPVRPGEMGSIGAQLTGTADAADAFAEQRRRAERVTGALGEALSALDDGDVDEAAARTSEARAAHDALAAWEVDLVTLPVWLETTDAMIGAMETIVAATRAGDAAAATAAAAEFAALRDEGATADRALRIAIGEGGAAVTAAPMGRLAEVLRAIAEVRASLAPLASPTDPHS